jgi:DNA repair exonuclease SbcCD ATPase subunit
MKLNCIRAFPLVLFWWLLFLCLPSGDAQAPAPNPPAVPYASVNQLNGLLSQLEQASQTAQLDMAKLRIDKWKTDSSNKHQTQANVESIQRNLQSAMPEIVAQLRNSPEDLPATFKLYRNLDALYDVFGSVVESAGAFGSKEEFQAMENDLGALEKSRRSFADRLETLAGAKEMELTRLRTALQNAQASANQPPKKVVVDDTEQPKKPVKKKASPKPGTSTTQPPPNKPQ